MRRKVYGKAVRNGWIAAVIGVLMIFAGFNFAELEKEMGYYSLVVFGMFIIIVGVVIVAVYSGMERSVKNITNSPSPLMNFMLSAKDYTAFSSAEADEIRVANRTSLYIALFFCVLIAVGGPLIVEDTGYYFTIIAFGIAVFLSAAQWIITRYRVGKLVKGAKEIILTVEGAYVGGEFHLWNVPLTFLSQVQYFNRGEYEGCELAVIRITYSAISGTIITPYTFIIPVPPKFEEQAAGAVQVLLSKVKGRKGF